MHKENFAKCKIFGYICPQQATKGNLKHFEACLSKQQR
jgi:hypothetical protein